MMKKLFVSNLNIINKINFINEMQCIFNNNSIKIEILFIKISNEYLTIYKGKKIFLKLYIPQLILISNKNYLEIKNYNIKIYPLNYKTYYEFIDILFYKIININNISTEIKLISKIGEGSNSKIYKIKDLNNNLVYACKKIKIKNNSFYDGINEINILKDLNNSNIVKLKNIYFNNKEIYAIMNLYYNIFEFNKLKKYKTYPIICLKVIKGLINALYYLKNEKIVHRDISLNNILFKRITKNINELDVLLSDFGACKKVNNEFEYIYRCGTPNFIDPIILNHNKLFLSNNIKKNIFSIDVFSLGCLFFYLITGEFIILNNNYIEESAQKLIKYLNKFTIENIIKQIIIDLCINMLNENLIERIKIEDLYNLKIFDDMYDYKI